MMAPQGGSALPQDDGERDHLAALSASVAAGFSFVHVPDGHGEVIALYAERERAGAVDMYAVRSQDDAWGARFRAEDYARRVDPVWHLSGTTADVVTALLALPPHGALGAPVRAQRTPSALWLPPQAG